MAKSFDSSYGKEPAKKSGAVNYGKIARDLRLRDTNGGDNRFRERVVKMEKYKKPKYRNQYDDE